MASKYLKLFKIPPGFEDILNDFGKEILRNKPPDIIDFGIKYFQALEEGIPFDYPDKGENLPCNYKRPTKKREIIRAINKMEMSIEDQTRFRRSMEKIDRMHTYDLPKRDPDPNAEVDGNDNVKILNVPPSNVTDKEININDYIKKDEKEKRPSKGEVVGTASRPGSNASGENEGVQIQVNKVVQERREVIQNGEVVSKEEKEDYYDDSNNEELKKKLMNEMKNVNDLENIDINEPGLTEVKVKYTEISEVNNGDVGEDDEIPSKQNEDNGVEEKEEPQKQIEDGNKKDDSTLKDEEPKQYEDNYEEGDEQEISRSKGDNGYDEDLNYEEPKDGEEEEAPNGSVNEEELKKQEKLKKDNILDLNRKKEISGENKDDDTGKGKSDKNDGKKEEDITYEEPVEDSFKQELDQSHKSDQVENSQKSNQIENSQETIKEGDEDNKDETNEKLKDKKLNEEKEDEDNKEKSKEIKDESGNNEEEQIRRRPSLMMQLSSDEEVEIVESKPDLSKITKIHAREILDSRGNPSIEVEVTLLGGVKERAMVPSGDSKGKNEAFELRDNDSRYNGKGVEKAVKNVNEIIAPIIEGMSSLKQIEIDKKLISLDGTNNKSKLGANAILGVSLAVARAGSHYLKIPFYRYIGGTNAKILPVPCMNVINGGVLAESTVDFQEYFIIPAGFTCYKEALRAGQEVFMELKNVIIKYGYDTGLGDEGSFCPSCKNGNEEPIKLINEAINNTQYKLGKQIFLGLDIASSEFYENGIYNLKRSGEGKKSSDEMIDYLEKLVNENPAIITIEDGLAESDWEGWKKLTERLGNKIQLVGDDLFCTNIKTIEKGIKEKIANSVLIKVNQVGTLSETLDAVRLAQSNNYTCMISDRSGETEDSSIADLAVGTNCGQIKSGSANRTDRMAKYNQLLRIEERLGRDAVFLGVKAFQNLKFD